MTQPKRIFTKLQNQIATRPLEKNYDFLFKIVITGDTNSGKSRILERYSKDRYSDNVPVTVGVEFTTKYVTLEDGKVVKLQLWDTAGSECYRSITTTYYRGAHAVIICYDVTNLQSFINLDYWLHQVKQVTDQDCVLTLCANKSDVMFKNPELREVNKEQAILYSQENNLLFFDECSAKLGLGVQQMFLQTLGMVVNVQMFLVKTGKTTVDRLKLTDEATSLNYDFRCCY